MNLWIRHAVYILAFAAVPALVVFTGRGTAWKTATGREFGGGHSHSHHRGHSNMTGMTYVEALHRYIMVVWSYTM